jgi:hypothetical protein
MKKYFSIKKPLKIILDITYWSGVIAIICSIPCGLIILLDKPAFMPSTSINSVLFTWMDSILYTMVINELRNIMGKIIKITPFTLDNVRGFRKISIYIIIIGVVHSINGILNNSLGLPFSFDNTTGLMKADIVLYLILAGTIAVIAEVLEKAVHLKDENDLTV